MRVWCIFVNVLQVFSKVGGVSRHHLPAELQTEMEGVEGDIQDLGQSVTGLKVPTGIDPMEIRSAVDTCRVGGWVNGEGWGWGYGCGTGSKVCWVGG